VSGGGRRDIRYSDHARRRMTERGITDDDVAWALARRVGSPQPGEPGTLWIHGYASGRKILKVCVRATDEWFVITAAWAD
jgi:hypothetical protein